MIRETSYKNILYVVGEKMSIHDLKLSHLRNLSCQFLSYAETRKLFLFQNKY